VASRTFSVTFDDSQLANMREYEELKQLIAQDIANQMLSAISLTIEVKLQ